MLTTDGWIYIDILKGMYGLRQADRILYGGLVKHLANSGHKPTKNTQGYWKHTTKRISFVLCVDAFGIKYVNKQELHHLLDALRDKYEITEDLTRSLYCGLHFKWNYHNRYVDLSMP